MNTSSKHIHGPDCDHDHESDHDEHVHGPDCDHDHELQMPFVRELPKIGRNDPCHCGSGKKYKKCHGAG